MAARDHIKRGSTEVRQAVSAAENEKYFDEENLEAKPQSPASAKNIARPPTALAVKPKGNIPEFSVCLIGAAELVPFLSEVEKINNSPRSESRTPLITVIQAILGAEGGSMPLSKLVPKVKKYWNRPFPATPYTDEELVFIMARNSDGVRVTE